METGTNGRGWGRGGWPHQNFQFFIIANLFFIEFQKRHKVTEVNLIHQGQNQRLNYHFLCHCPLRKAQEQL